jgi:hypothetical protein
MLREAVDEEKQRRDARAKVSEDGFERVEVYDSRRERDVAFQGREIGYSEDADQTAWLTAKESIAVWGDRQGELWVYDNFQEFADDDPPADLAVQVADALGEKYVEELDI